MYFNEKFILIEWVLVMGNRVFFMAIFTVVK